MSASLLTTRFPQPMAAKVPAIGLAFWIIKVLTTGMGEAASDYLSHLSLLIAGAFGVLGFAAAMWLQFRSRRYVAGIYWFAVAMVAVFGTMVADGLHVGLDVPYAGSTAFYAAAVAVVFFLWHRSERTLSIHSIITRRREIYYWATVLMTFALGTAVGDLTAASMHLGYLTSAALFAAVMVVPVVGWWKLGLDPVVAFWFAYVVTRPLGASVADWLGKRPSLSGLGLGDGPVTLVAVIAIVGLVAWFASGHRDSRPAPTPAGDSPATIGDDPGGRPSSTVVR